MQVNMRKNDLGLQPLPGGNQDCWLLEYPWQLEKNKNWSVLLTPSFDKERMTAVYQRR